MTEFETIRYEAAEGIAAITLARPEKRNAVNMQMFAELGDAAERAAADSDIRVVMVSGEGPSFCAGIDVAELGALPGLEAKGVRDLASSAQRPFHSLATMAKPTLAAVRGHAIGAGFQLALACDLRIASRNAVFGMFEIRFGLLPDLGGNHRLAGLVGPALAKELIWTGRTVDAGEAERIGLANRVVDDDALEAEANALASRLAAAPPIPVALTKDLLGRAAERGLEATMDREREGQAKCVGSDDHKEAVAAFFEKRPGRYHGR